MKDIVLSNRRVNSFRMRIQGLSGSPPDIAEVLEAVGWLPVGADAYLALQARVRGFRREDLDRIVFSEGAWVETLAFRGRAFLLPRAVAAAALRCPSPREREEAEASLDAAGVPRAGRRIIRDAVLRAVEDEPGTIGALRGRLSGEKGAVGEYLSLPGVLEAVLVLLRHEGSLTRTRPAGPLDAGEPVFTTTARLLPDLEVAGLDPREAMRRLCAFYFRVHGPATQADFGWWCAGDRALVAAVFEDHRPRLARVRVGDLAYRHYLPRTVLERLLAHGRGGAEEVALVPAGDPWLASYETRVGRFLEPEDVTRIGRYPSPPLILVSGRVAGTWEWDPVERRTNLHWLRPAADAVRLAVENRVAELSTFLARSRPPAGGSMKEGAAPRSPLEQGF